MQLRFENGVSRALTLSYDDGQIHDIRLIEIMNRYGIKGTFNLNSGYFFENGKGFRGEKTIEEAREIYKGHEIAVHGLTHPFTSELNEQEILLEVWEDRKNLEKAFGGIVRGMAYPFGCFNDKTVNVLKTAGIAYSRTTIATKSFDIPEDWLRMQVTCHHYEPELMTLAKRFIEEDGRWGRPSLFYVWGHSYEFARNDDWNVIEDFCKYTGGRDNVWYATNIEIYDYVKAFESLITNTDKTEIFNPSCRTVWFAEGGETYAVKPGETIKR